MSTIVTRAGKGASLTWTEADANFTNLNTDKAESSDLIASGGSDLIGYTNGQAGAVTRTVQDSLRERMVSVMDYGATGDGTTDDSAAIQAAIYALVSSQGGGIVFFPRPAVSYIIGTAIDLTSLSNIWFLGAGDAEFQTSNSVKLQAKATLTGAMFSASQAPPANRCGGFKFSGLHFDGNQQNVDAFYIHGDDPANAGSRFIEFEGCVFEGLRTGLWLGDYTNETPNLTYLLGVNVYRCMFNDCVYPIIADAGGFDGLTLEQVWIVDLNDRTLKAIQVLVQGTTISCQNVWFSLGTAATHGIYCALTTALTLRDSSFEGNTGTETFVAVEMPNTGGASLGGVIIDNIRIQSVAGATAISVNNPAGMEIRSSSVDGNIVVGANCLTFAQNVSFASGTYTGTTGNVNIDGAISGTWVPTVTAGAGTITTYTATGVYKKIGSLVSFQITVTLTNVGTASGAMVSTLPFTNGNQRIACSGVEAALTGFALYAYIAPSGGVVSSNKYDGTGLWTNNGVHVITGTYFV